MALMNGFDSLMPRAFDQEVGEDFLVVLIGHDLVIVGVELIAAFAQAFEIFLEMIEVMRTHHRRFREQAAVGFHIDETHRAVELELQLAPVEQMKHREVVLAKTQVLKTVQQRLHVAEKSEKIRTSARCLMVSAKLCSVGMSAVSPCGFTFPSVSKM